MNRAAWNFRIFVLWSVLELVALTVWVGGLVVIIGAVIPAVFNNVSMEMGGHIITRTFTEYNKIVGGAITLMVMASGWRLWIARGGRYPAAEMGRSECTVITTMIVCAAAIILWLGPASVVLQGHAFAAEGVTAKKEAYEAFFRMHTVVKGLYVVNLILGIGLMTMKITHWLRPFRR